MATYFHGGAEIQQGGDNLQTLYLMNPNYFTTTPNYSENHPNNNNINNNNNNHQILLNSAITPQAMTHGNVLQTLPHQQHQLLGIPLSGPHHQNHTQITTNMQGLGLTRVHYTNNNWSEKSEGGGPGQPDDQIQELAGQAQGSLSLSLTPGQKQHQKYNNQVTVASGPGGIIGSKFLRATQELLEEVVNVGGIGGDNGESSGVHKAKEGAKVDDDLAGVEQGGGDGGSGGGESSKKAVELTTAQRQELLMKKAKLLNMLDEVEQRYRQYHTQIQIIISSFEQAAGIGSAKSYTSLALKTISKQFRCLKDAITSQIKATSKSLGEEDDNGGVKLEGGAGSRLRFVDQQIRQQRALQQLGMVQHNAWRPQRGLPERAVSVLRAWLFEHFLHPYPKDSDKHMLAKQTGLTRSQVSNWFINARVRLWKPMVEEMYVEEMKSHEQNGGTSEDNNTTTTTTTTNNAGIGTSSSKNEQTHDHSTTTNTTIIPQEQQNGAYNNNMIQNHHQITNDMISTLSTMSSTPSQGFTLIGSSSDMESLMARTQKKHRNNNNSDMNSPSSILSMDMEMKPIDHQKYGHQEQLRHQSSMIGSPGVSGVGFNPYIVNNDDMGRFNPDQITASYHRNAVSLTLGLPHCENISMHENHQQNFFPNQGMDLGRRVDIGPNEDDFCGISMGQTSHPNNNVYESIDLQSRKRFASQMLHDFVA